MLKQHGSIWIDTTPPTRYPELINFVKTDVAIIGGGIAGITAAYFLQKAGFKVAVVEAERIVAGTSGNTTAKVTSQHTLKYSLLEKKFGREKAQLYAQSHQWALKEIERIIKNEQIACDFQKLPAFTFSQTEKGLNTLRKEFEICKSLGLPASFLTTVKELPFEVTGALKYDDQACFHPRKFLLGLVKKMKNVTIFEYSRAISIEENDAGCTVKTIKGTIKSKCVIVASNYPMYDKGLFFLRMNQVRSYALAVRLKKMPKGMFISSDNPRISIRPHKSGRAEWMIFGGANHVTGDGASEGNRYELLEGLLKKRFKVNSIDYRWSAQDSFPIDNAPYIGKMPRAKNIYVTTGYGEWGMTTSVVSAKLLSDLVEGESNTWEELYAPSRLKSLAAFKKGADHVKRVVKSFTDHITKDEIDKLSDLTPGSGKVISIKGKKVAISKDQRGKITAVSATCTHMGCVVDWNNTEKSWDCPCHGSRFTPTGNVLTGPALRPLEQKTFKRR